MATFTVELTGYDELLFRDACRASGLEPGAVLAELAHWYAEKAKAGARASWTPCGGLCIR